MPSIDTALYTRLSGLPGLSEVVSTRIYPPPVPQNAAYPLVTYQQISGVRDYAMGVQSPIVRARFQLDCWSTNSAGARTVAEQVRLGLSKYRGTSDTIVIDHIELENETRFYEDEVSLHRMSQDYFVWYRETPP